MSVTRRKSGAKKRAVTNKWSKTQVLLGEKDIRPHIPLTKRMSESALRDMLRDYKMVYVKPTYGSLGKGVMRVERTGAPDGGQTSGYAYQMKEKRRSFKSFEEMYRAIKRDAGGKLYLVQRGIHLLTYENRAYDLRVVVQQTPGGGAETTGIVARIAHPLKIVTNGSQGGTILPAEQVLQPYAGAVRVQRLLAELDRIGLKTFRRLRRKYSVLKEIGLDIALDKNLRPWILEVNSRPDHCPFAILEDKTMIRRIVHYGRQYGREYKLNCNKAKAVL